MDSYGNNSTIAGIATQEVTTSNELSTFNYSNYVNSYETNANETQINTNGYYFPNGQYMYYNGNYGAYYQPQPYGHYAAPQYYQSQYQVNYNTNQVSGDTSTKVDVSSSSSSSNTSTSDASEYASSTTAVSPVPTSNRNDQSTPVSSSIIQNINAYYPTPPTDVSDSESREQKEMLKKISNIETSPEIVPRDEHSNDDSNNDDNSMQSRIKRRTRTQFTKYQIDYLESVFGKNHYPDVQTVDHMAEKLGLAIERISVWFQNRRAKFKKTKKPTNFSAERLYSDDRNTRTVSLTTRDPVAFQKFANHLAPKPLYGGIQTQNHSWPNFNANLIQDRFKN